MRWLETLLGTFGEPENVAPTGDPARVAEVEEILARLRPHAEADGGDIRLVAVTEDGEVHVRLEGACARCAAHAETLHGGLEPELRRRCAWFRAVRRV